MELLIYRTRYARQTQPCYNSRITLTGVRLCQIHILPL
ncbi:hypothetical protein VPHK453_0021 [Vibrio phage K453]